MKCHNVPIKCHKVLFTLDICLCFNLIINIFVIFFFIDSWISVCSPFIPKYLSSPRSVCVDGTIYLVADNTKKVYAYDPEANIWQKVGLVITADSKLNTLNSPFARIHPTRHLSNTFGFCSLQVQLLHMLHENGGLVSLDGKLFVTGGHWKGMEGDYGVEVEVYNRASNIWEVESSLPRLWFYSGVCTIFLDPNQWPELEST